MHEVMLEVQSRGVTPSLEFPTEADHAMYSNEPTVGELQQQVSDRDWSQGTEDDRDRIRRGL